jgi:pSer/pThr/pTyr-binding forkhead associated (FHA) protein
MQLILKVRATDKTFTFNTEKITELVIGRVNPYTGDTPDIDLESCGGKDMGVSRRHAAISRQGRSLGIVDLGSDNGTFVNGQRLPPNTHGELQHGDEIRLGHLVMRLTLAKTRTRRTTRSQQSRKLR